MCRRRQVPQPRHAMRMTLMNLRRQTVLPMIIRLSRIADGVRFTWPRTVTRWDTALLAVRSWGAEQNPWVEVSVGEFRIQQYLDANAVGVRWLNLSGLREQLAGWCRSHHSHSCGDARSRSGHASLIRQSPRLAATHLGDCTSSRRCRNCGVWPVCRSASQRGHGYRRQCRRHELSCQRQRPGGALRPQRLFACGR